LDSASYQDLLQEIQRQSNLLASGVKVDFIVVYGRTNPNNGQLLTNGGYTGPILCVAPGTTSTGTDESTPLQNVEIRGTQDALIIQNKPSGAAAINTGDRFCHSTLNNVDCFRIGP
jgi:hypothetical protein